MSAKLVINHGTPEAQEFELKPGPNRFGRGPDNDFRIEEPSVSTNHALIVLEDGVVTVKDLASTNGTFISRSQVKEGFLHPGQVLQLGRIEMVFVADAPAQAESKGGGFAPTIALPQVGGMKIVRPVPLTAASFKTAGSPPTAPTPAPVAAPPPAPVFAAPPPPPPAPVPAATPAPFFAAPPPPTPAPAPVFASAPAATPPPAPAPVAPISKPQPAAPAPTPARAPAPAPATQRQPVPMQDDSGVLFRCLALGTGGAALAGVGWMTFAAFSGSSPAPYSCGIAGLICGLALMVARGERRGLVYSLIATGFCLLAIFIGEFGQAFINPKLITFPPETIVGLLVGMVVAWWIGGGGSFKETTSYAR